MIRKADGQSQSVVSDETRKKFEEKLPQYSDVQLNKLRFNPRLDSVFRDLCAVEKRRRLEVKVAQAALSPTEIETMPTLEVFSDNGYALNGTTNGTLDIAYAPDTSQADSQLVITQEAPLPYAQTRTLPFSGKRFTGWRKAGLVAALAGAVVGAAAGVAGTLGAQRIIENIRDKSDISYVFRSFDKPRTGRIWSYSGSEVPIEIGSIFNTLNKQGLVPDYSPEDFKHVEVSPISPVGFKREVTNAFQIIVSVKDPSMANRVYTIHLCQNSSNDEKGLSIFSTSGDVDYSVWNRKNSDLPLTTLWDKLYSDSSKAPKFVGADLED